MHDKEKRFGKVIAFYQLLPESLLYNIIYNLPVNRDIRRKLSKIKSSKNKIEMIMSSKLRKIFVDTAYNTVRDSIPLELNISSYDDIISCITDDNKVNIAIFFFRWCYEEGICVLPNSVQLILWIRLERL